MTVLQDPARALLIGIGATAFLDIWLLALRSLGIPTLDFALLGRWFGHLLRGQVAHAAIAKAQPIHRELALGWFAHYATGIAFAAVLLGLQGPDWARQPTLEPALGFGLLTVLAPLLLLQPAMGAGLASRRTATPMKNVLRSLANHAVFGLGLYLSSSLAALALR